MSTSVLIVNFRAYEDLERCLQSLDGQLRAGDDVIVLDNESQPALAAAVGRKFPVATIIPSDVNLGFAAGVNIAARHARNPFLLLLNPDTVVEGPLLVVLEEYLASHPDTAVVGPRVVNGDGSIQPSARAFPGFSTLLGGRSAWFTRQYPDNPWARRNLLGLTARAPLRVDWLSGSCLMTRRDVFERLGGFDESFFLYWEDADYCRRVSDLGLHRTYLPSVSVRHFGGGSARYNLARAIREFHKSAYLLHCRQCGLVGRVGAPLVRAGLYVRGELRVRRALAVARQAPAAANHEPPPASHLQSVAAESHLDSVAT
jgi:GT2 family glycosyltransferase